MVQGYCHGPRPLPGPEPAHDPGPAPMIMVGLHDTEQARMGQSLVVWPCCQIRGIWDNGALNISRPPVHDAALHQLVILPGGGAASVIIDLLSGAQHGQKQT